MLVISQLYFVQIRFNGLYSDYLCLFSAGKSLGNCQVRICQGKNSCRKIAVGENFSWGISVVTGKIFCQFSTDFFPR